MTDRWPNYSQVRFREGTAQAAALHPGADAYIIEVWPDAYDVEVSDPSTGETLWLGSVRDEDLQLIQRPADKARGPA